ncbi:outer membrane lipoprotein carrier protein LolA [Epibacterium sp. DP7N7-1]|nr:outer membrane lipoprotein carrier protein LolA [Epibacterium sp. DP7N7-1]
MLGTLRTAMLSISLVFAASSALAQATLDDVSAWFNGWSTLTSPFTQTNDDGSTSTGTLYMKRPGRLRIDYEDHDAMLLVSNGSIAVFDGSSKRSKPQIYPLRQTPLWQILRSDVDLGHTSAIRSARRTKDGLIHVRVYDPKRPDAGELELQFADRNDNAFLVGWISYPQSGEIVRVQLTAPIIGRNLPSSLFNQHNVTNR